MVDVPVVVVFVLPVSLGSATTALVVNAGISLVVKVAISLVVRAAISLVPLIVTSGNVCKAAI